MERPTARQSAWQWQERIGIRDRKTLDGDQSLFFNRLMDLGDPLEDFDAVNKKYVDDVFGDGEIIVVIGSVDDIADLDLDPGSIAGSDADAVMAVHLAMYDHTLIGSGVDLTEHLAAYDHTNIHPSNIIDGDTVDVSGRDTGDVLTWNGAMWVPAPSSGTAGATGSAVSVLYVTVGASGCDYTTDGTDDAVQIQEAIDYCAGAAGRPRTVVLLNQEYNLGNYVITLHRDIELRGMISSRVAADGGSWSSGKCTTLNVTSVTYNAVVMHSGSALRYLRFDYPNQSASSVITYPATITDDVDIVSGISGIIVEDVVGCMPYNFIDFSTDVATTRVDYTINRIRGDPLKYGISIDKCVHLCVVTDAQFVPGFGGRIVPNHGTLLNYMTNNLRAFYSNQNDGGYFQNCITWCSNQAFVVGSSGICLNNCMGDASHSPLTIASASTTSVIGGYYVALVVYWDGSNYSTLSPVDAIAVIISGQHTCVVGTRIVSSETCIHVSPFATDTVISDCAIDNVTTSGDTSDWIALIWDVGKRSSITGNTICSSDVSGTNIMGILVDGEDCVYSGNVIKRGVFSNSLGDYHIYDDEVRCVVECISRNNGDPNSTGNWYGKRRPGVIVHDYTNDKRYIDVSAFGQTPTWREI